MKNPLVILCSTLLMLSLQLNAQIDHWESIIPENSFCRYQVPTSLIPNWQSQSFNDAAWNQGNAPIGYGESNIASSVNAGTITVYLRKLFTINDLNDIEAVLLHMDFDDGFVAYVNNVEVARTLISGTPSFDQTSDGLHESVLYQGGVPESFSIDRNILTTGTNILSIEVHNDNGGSSDLVAHPILIVGVNNASSTYFSTPSWFIPPFNFSSSDLPIVHIDTQGANIENDPKVAATFRIIHNDKGNRNYLSDQPSFDWYCGIEIRGESSQFFDKKSYALEIWDQFGNDMDTTFLNFPSEEDFILYGPFSDKTQMNNVMAMHIGNQMGRYASRTRYVELVVNNDYKGLYVLMEKIKRDDNRVNISKLNPDEISGDDLTGGYIVRIDKGIYDGWSSQFSAYGNPGNNIYFQFYYPDQADIHPAQEVYIQSYMDEFEEALASPSFQNRLGIHYSEYISLRSFVDTFILNELSKNVDGYRLSTYFNKQKESKGGELAAGPFWDFNLAFGNGDYCSGDDVTGWEYYQCQGNSPFWWDAMLQDTLFTNALNCRWTDLRTNLLETSQLNKVIDSLTVIIDEAQDRNFQRWPNLGTYVWPNPPYFYENISSHAQIIRALKVWLLGRTEWMDQNMPGIARNCQAYEEEVDDEPTEALRLNMYPNPASEYVSFETSLTIYSVRLIDIAGKNLVDIPYSDGDNRYILPSNLKLGVYFVLIQTERGLKMKKLMIEK